MLVDLDLTAQREGSYSVNDFVAKLNQIYYRNEFYFLLILSMCKLRRITHKLNKARRAL